MDVMLLIHKDKQDMEEIAHFYPVIPLKYIDKN